MTRTACLIVILSTLAACDMGALLGGNQTPQNEVVIVEPEPEPQVTLECPEGTDLPDCPA